MGKILVVDDEPDVREVIGDILTAHGHTVLLADGVYAALALLAIECPQVDVMVSDVRMPSNGHTLVAQVARLYPGISIVMMTGFDAPDAAVFVWPMLHKPFKMTLLITAVTSALASRALRPEPLAP